MNNTEAKTDVIQYQAKGTCCKMMQVKIRNGVVQNAELIGGCPGNLIGIQNLVKGMAVDEVITKFSGISCGDKSTSCPDQLASCLAEYKAHKEARPSEKSCG